MTPESLLWHYHIILTPSLTYDASFSRGAYQTGTELVVIRWVGAVQVTTHAPGLVHIVDVEVHTDDRAVCVQEIGGFIRHTYSTASERRFKPQLPDIFQVCEYIHAALFGWAHLDCGPTGSLDTLRLEDMTFMVTHRT